MTTAQTVEFRASAQFNPVFRPVNEWRGRYRILKGSAGSGKSVNIAQDYIAKLSDPAYQGANLVVVRKIEETNRDSTFAELQAAIYRMFGPYADRFWKVNLNPLALECKITGNRIIFRGVKDQRQREKIKSITFKNGKLVWIWCEEATELLPEDVDILDDRLRGNLDDLNPNLYYQITMTFNPVSATHWIKARYFDKSDPDVLTHHSTYRTNRFIDPAYSRRMERRKEEDPDGYRVYGLGEWGELGGLILTTFEVHNFPTGRDYFDGFYYGQDFGFNHADAILGVGWKDGEIYDQAVRLLTRKEFQEWKATLGEYITRIAAEPDPRVKALLTAQLDALSTNSRISRLEALLGQIDLKLNELWETGVSQMKAEFGETFREGYYEKVYDIQSRAGFIHEFAKLDESVVENVLSYPWSGAILSSTPKARSGATRWTETCTASIRGKATLHSKGGTPL